MRSVKLVSEQSLEPRGKEDGGGVGKASVE